MCLLVCLQSLFPPWPIRGDNQMYSAILIWIIGILVTYGFNVKMFEDFDTPKKDRIWFALSLHLWFCWPVLLGDGIRRVLDKKE